VPPEQRGLNNGYLLVNAVFDGSRDRMVERLYEAARGPFQAIFAHCYGFERNYSHGRKAFNQYVRACEVSPSWHYRDVRGHSVASVVTALAKQRALIELFRDVALKGDPGALARRFDEFATEIRAAVREEQH
jgi:hypothetical protein